MINEGNRLIRKEKVAVVIPSYNESGNIERIVPLIFSIIPYANIVVVDDNSPDGTKDVIRSLQKKYKHLHLVLRSKKGGRGSAVIDGFRYAYRKINPKFYVEMDADFSHTPQEILKLINLSEEKTVVVASRYIEGGKILNVELKRRMLSYLANFIIRFVLKNPLIDNTNGFRCYRKDAIKRLISYKFISKGYIVLSEVATLLNREGFRFIEFPTIFINRKRGKSNATISEFRNSFLGLLNVRKHLLKA